MADSHGFANIVLRAILGGNALVFRQVHGEGASLPEFGFDGDLAAVQQRQVLHDREAETGAAHLTRPRAIDAIEALEERSEMLRWNAVAVVAHADLLSWS